MSERMIASAGMLTHQVSLHRIEAEAQETAAKAFAPKAFEY